MSYNPTRWAAGGAAAVALWLLAVALQPAAAALQGSPCASNVSYAGTVCPSYIMNYDIAVPADAVPAMDAALASFAKQVAVIKLSDVNCYNALIALTCGDVFPRCFNGTTQLPCQSSCQETVTVCTPFFTRIGGLALLTADTQGCLKISAADPEPYPTKSCFIPDAIAAAASNATNSTGPSDTPGTPGTVIPDVCPAYYLPAPSLQYLNSAINCDPPSGCCVPCPYQVITFSRKKNLPRAKTGSSPTVSSAQVYFYPAGSYDRMAQITFWVNTVTAALAFFVALSWSVLPGRREHPGDIILQFSIAVTLWMAVHLFKSGNERRTQCADDVTIATAANNRWCAAMGAVLIFAMHASVLWASVMVKFEHLRQRKTAYLYRSLGQILNVHLTVVWRSNLLKRFKLGLAIACWVLPLIATVITFAVGTTIDASVPTVCFISPTQINSSLFAVQGLFIVASVVAMLYTCGYIAYMAKGWKVWRHMDDDDEVDAVGSDDYKPIRSPQQFLAVMRTNGRSLVLGVAFMLTYVCYIILHNVVLIPTYRANAYTPYVKQWQACNVKAYAENPDPIAAQNLCADQVSGSLPSIAALGAAYVATGVVGVWTFVVLVTDRAVVRDWMGLLLGGCCRRRSGGGRRSGPGGGRETAAGRKGASSVEYTAAAASPWGSGGPPTPPSTASSGSRATTPARAGSTDPLASAASSPAAASAVAAARPVYAPAGAGYLVTFPDNAGGVLSSGPAAATAVDGAGAGADSSSGRRGWM
ncbi:hypothetical protein DFJ73DRAFT_958978 [Zopfochytrium polystomum]|nr:hypothetical protein DFJ73DRAFT_958978 [Zopfochytrium polystomum]